MPFNLAMCHKCGATIEDGPHANAWLASHLKTCTSEVKASGPTVEVKPRREPKPKREPKPPKTALDPNQMLERLAKGAIDSAIKELFKGRK